MRKGRVESPITTNHLTLTRAPGPGAERVVARVDSEHHTRTDRAAGAGGDGVEQPFITVSFSVNGTVEKVRSRARGSERA
jgi:hypothetical protein